VCVEKRLLSSRPDEGYSSKIDVSSQRRCLSDAGGSVSDIVALVRDLIG